MSSSAAVIMATAKDQEEAGKIATHLIEQHLAACVQEIAIRSHFNWEGKTNCEPEVLLLVKTAADRVDQAVAAIKSVHSYDIPEIIVLPVVGGLPAYLGWINAETRAT